MKQVNVCLSLSLTSPRHGLRQAGMPTNSKAGYHRDARVAAQKRPAARP